jgi:hypothetical protein
MKVFLVETDKSRYWRERLKNRFENIIVDAAERKEGLTLPELELLQEERNRCDHVLYVITPQLEDLDVISQLIDDSNKHPEKTIFCFTESEGDKRFSTHQIKSLKAIGAMVKNNGGHWLDGLDGIIRFISTSNAYH